MVQLNIFSDIPMLNADDRRYRDYCSSNVTRPALPPTTYSTPVVLESPILMKTVWDNSIRKWTFSASHSSRKRSKWMMRHRRYSGIIIPYYWPHLLYSSSSSCRPVFPLIPSCVIRYFMSPDACRSSVVTLAPNCWSWNENENEKRIHPRLHLHHSVDSLHIPINIHICYLPRPPGS